MKGLFSGGSRCIYVLLLIPFSVMASTQAFAQSSSAPTSELSQTSSTGASSSTGQNSSKPETPTPTPTVTPEPSPEPSPPDAFYYCTCMTDGDELLYEPRWNTIPACHLKGPGGGDYFLETGIIGQNLFIVTQYGQGGADMFDEPCFAWKKIHLPLKKCHPDFDENRTRGRTRSCWPAEGDVEVLASMYFDQLWRSIEELLDLLSGIPSRAPTTRHPRPALSWGPQQLDQPSGGVFPGGLTSGPPYKPSVESLLEKQRRDALRRFKERN